MMKIFMVVLGTFVLALKVSAQSVEDVPSKIKISGDIRYRHKATTTEKQDERRFHELRARVGFQGTVNEKTKAVFRLATGVGGISTNTQLGNTKSSVRTYENKAFNLDLGYISYKPLQSLEVMLGKTTNPFYAAGKSQIIWDSDLSPEGLALKSNFNLSEGMDLFFNAGAFWVSENFDSTTGKDTDDMNIVGAQLGLKFNFFPWKVVVGAGQTSYNGFKGQKLPEVTGSSGTPPIYTDANSIDPTTGSYLKGFKLTDAFLEASAQISDFEPVVFAHSVTNTEVSESALWAGVGLNYGLFSAAIANARIEKDAVVSRFVDSDIGSSDVTATRYIVGYKAAENTSLALNYQQYTTPMERGTSKYWTMFDVMVLF